jgi:hypothetical protein
MAALGPPAVPRDVFGIRERAGPKPAIDKGGAPNRRALSRRRRCHATSARRRAVSSGCPSRARRGEVWQGGGGELPLWDVPATSYANRPGRGGRVRLPQGPLPGASEQPARWGPGDDLRAPAETHDGSSLRGWRSGESYSGTACHYVVAARPAPLALRRRDRVVAPSALFPARGERDVDRLREVVFVNLGRPRLGTRVPVNSSPRCLAHRSLSKLLLPARMVIVSDAGCPQTSHTNTSCSATEILPLACGAKLTGDRAVLPARGCSSSCAPESAWGSASRRPMARCWDRRTCRGSSEPTPATSGCFEQGVRSGPRNSSAENTVITAERTRGRGGFMARDRRLSEKELDEKVQELLKEVEGLRREATNQGAASQGLDEEALRRKLRGETSESPFFYYANWAGSVAIGQSAYVIGYVHNPDPIVHSPLYLTLFFGLSNGSSDITDGWVGRDTRWNSTSAVFGLDSGGSVSRIINYTVPTVERPGTYVANLLLWGSSFGNPNQFFDRWTLNVYVT